MQLDEIFRTFDPKTRKAFQTWMQESAAAISGQGQNLSYGIGQLEPTLKPRQLFRVLDTPAGAVGQLFRNSATSLEALRGREGELQSLIRSSNAVFETTARAQPRHRSALPRLPDLPGRVAADPGAVESFALNADPLMKQLVPVAKQLSPTLIAFANQAPEAKGFFEGLAPVIAQAPTGFPAFRKFFRDDLPPLLRRSTRSCATSTRSSAGFNLYKHEVTSCSATSPRRPTRPCRSPTKTAKTSTTCGR